MHASAVLGLELAQTLHDDRVGLRHDPHCLGDSDDDEQGHEGQDNKRDDLQSRE